MTNLHRRRFLAASSAFALSSAASGSFSEPSSVTNPICVFTKPFVKLPFVQLAERIAQLGVDGLEAPIRKGGHVEPQAVPDRLPELVDTLKAKRLTIHVMASDINDPDALNTESVLKTAAALDIPFYRMKYFKYDESRPIAPQIDRWKGQLKDLAAMNRQFGITGVYQNHAGRTNFGAAIWDLHIALDGISPGDVGVAYDIRHATVEGGMSWPVTFQLIQPHVQVVYVKDFDWTGSKVHNVPLGEGRIDSGFFRMLKETGFTGPVSLHEEYLDHKDPTLTNQHSQAMQKDLAKLREWL